MNLTKVLVKLLIFKLIARTSLAGIIMETSKSEDSSSLVETTAKFLKSCYGTRVQTIGLAGNIPGTLIASLSLKDHLTIPIIFVDNTDNSVNDGFLGPRISRYRLQLFTIAASSSTELEITLMSMKKLRWWNHQAHFYMLDWPASETGCSRAFEFLWTAWRMNLLVANFVCNDWINKKRLIYTFNPFTTSAPDPWKLSRIYNNDGKENPWSMFVQEYHDDYRDLCESINFEKTKDLGGYGISFMQSPIKRAILVNPDKIGIDLIGGGNTGNILLSIFRILNATVKLPTRERVKDYPAEPIDGVSGVGTVKHGFRFDVQRANVTELYKHYRVGLSVMTQYRDQQESRLSNIFSLLDVSTQILVGIVCLVTPIFLRYFVHQTSTAAILNLFRVITKSSMTNLPDITSARIYLTALFMFFITVIAIFEGRLSAILTMRRPIQNVNTMKDLVKSDYTIYSYNYFAPLIKDRVPVGRFVGVATLNCTEHVLRDSSAACVSLEEYTLPDAARFKLSLSSDLITVFHIACTVREDWPLESKFNTIVQAANEAHLFYHSYNSKVEKLLRDVKANDNENINKNEAFRTLTLRDLWFAFVILGIGLVCATLSFIVEIIVRREPRSRITEARRHFRGRLIG